MTRLCRGQPLWECPTLNISICLAGFAGVLEPVGGLRAFDTSALVGSALGCWVKEGLELVVHVPSECVAKINIP